MGDRGPQRDRVLALVQVAGVGVVGGAREVLDLAHGRLLGAEAAGSSTDKLIDVCATAIWGRLSYPDLIDLDLAYSPPYGPALSPVIQAATILSGQFERAREGVRATE